MNVLFHSADGSTILEFLEERDDIDGRRLANRLPVGLAGDGIGRLRSNRNRLRTRQIRTREAGSRDCATVHLGRAP